MGLVRHGQAWLARRLHLYRRCRSAPGAVQRSGRHRRQALFPWLSKPRCGGPGHPAGLGGAATEGARVIGLVWVLHSAGVPGKEISILALLVTVSAGVLMVSNIRYRSFKDLDLRGRVPF